MELDMNLFMEKSISIHGLRVLDGKDAARTYRLNVFRLVRLARHRRRSGRHGYCVSLLLLVAACVSHALHVNSFPSTRRRPESLISVSDVRCYCLQHEVS